MSHSTLTNLPTDLMKGGKGGKGGETDDIQITNAKFIADLMTHIPEGAHAAVCSKPGDPNKGGWTAHRAETYKQKLTDARNNYLTCASFYPGTNGSFKARKDRFAACHFLMLDDLGTKVSLDRLAGFELSWLIETSPNNYQGGILLAEALTDGTLAERLLNTLIEAELCDPGAHSPWSRWARLPVAINGKTKHRDADGTPFQCRLLKWQPHRRYTPEEIIDGLQLELLPVGRPTAVTGSSKEIDTVFKPKATENPVLVELRARGLYKKTLGSSKHDITCPWVLEHTDALDSGAAYFEPDSQYPRGGFCCQHSHQSKYHIRQLLEFLGIQDTEARHKPVIRVVGGDLHRVVDAAEKVLADGQRHYQAGGLIVSIQKNPVTEDPQIVPITLQALTRELSSAATWEKYDGRMQAAHRCDPPSRPASILYEAQEFHHLRPLAGVVRQPYFREIDGELITQPGYDEISKYFGVFDPHDFVIDDPTQESARLALTLLEELLSEFHFVSPADKSAALSAIFTAVVRSRLPHAPGFHIKAPVYGSGKTYLCELIGAFAGPAGNTKVSYPTTSEEATKVILSLLMTNPAVIEFDDMDTDWIPHGIIKRMLTSEHISDRILGTNKTATVSTRTLFLGSGNNTNALRDLRRRILTINLDPRCATPTTLSYQMNPLDLVQKNRSKYVSAVLTIISAHRKAGLPRADVKYIATYGGAWSDYCRHPLIWLGLPDPATVLLEQIEHDPDADALGNLMTEWRKAFGSTPTTVRNAVEAAFIDQSDLLDAMKEFPVEEKGEVNRSKLGWLLKKNVNRIINGYEFQKAEADGRNAWCVVEVKSPPLPLSPPFSSSDVETVYNSEHEDE